MIIEVGIQYAQVLSEMGTETFVDAHKDSAPAKEIDTYLKDKYSLPAIIRELSDSKNIYHIIKFENKIAGFSKMMLNSKHPGIHEQNVAKIDQIYLRHSFQGLKLGAELLQFNIELSKSNDQAGMWLVVWVGNLKAISFYEKFGFMILSDGDFHLTSAHTNRCHIMFLKY